MRQWRRDGKAVEVRMLRVPLAAASCSNGEKHCSSEESGGDIMIAAAEVESTKVEQAGCQP